MRKKFLRKGVGVGGGRGWGWGEREGERGGKRGGGCVFFYFWEKEVFTHLVYPLSYETKNKRLKFLKTCYQGHLQNNRC